MKLWIARDRQGNLGLFVKKPTWRTDLYQIPDWFNDSFFVLLDNDLYPEVTFENSPQEVEFEFKLVKK